MTATPQTAAGTTDDHANPHAPCHCEERSDAAISRQQRSDAAIPRPHAPAQPERRLAIPLAVTTEATTTEAG